MARKPLTQEQALAHYTELQRRVSVGAYLEPEHDGSFPPDDGSPESTTLESLHNLETWAANQGLEFSWHQDRRAWTLEPIARSGECAECGRFRSQLSPQGYCEGCVMQAAIDAMSPEERWK